MPKKTTYSRSGGQASRKKQKSIELVRPDSGENVLETVGKSKGVSALDVKTPDVSELENEGYEEGQEDEVEEEKVQVGGKRSEPVKKAVEPAKKSAAVATVAVAASSNSKSVASRMAARRQSGQKSLRSTANLILAENYAYVRKDLVFILILAVIMFAAIIVMHFVPAIGG